jgi:hypothetical protein
MKKRVNESSKNKLNAYAFAHSFGIIGIISILFYALFVWFGEYNPALIVGQFPVGFEFNNLSFIFGVVQSYVLAYVVGWIFVKVYNKSL